MGAVVPPWHVLDPEALRVLVREVEIPYPTLHVISTKDRVVIRGSFPVRDGDEVLDWYSVEVELAPEHPRSLPVVREVGGRIPWLLNRHVLPDGSACVVLPDAYWLTNPSGEVSVREFLDGPLHGYFLGQSLVEIGEPWPQGEWAHGTKGIVDFYSSVFRVDGLDAICGLLLAASKPLKGHLPCPCGSNRRYRDCHRERVAQVRDRVPSRRILRCVQLLIEDLKKTREAARQHGD